MIVFNDEIIAQIGKLVKENHNNYDFYEIIEKLYHKLYRLIPDKNRISYGSYYIVHNTGRFIYKTSQEQQLSIENPALNLLNNGSLKAKGIGLSALSYLAIDNPKKYLKYFEQYADDDHWEMREFAAGFMHQICKNHPDVSKSFYLRLVKSESPNIRRFVSESLRPVSANRWIQKQPEYSLSIIKHLFKEKHNYPRTSVGNNLSDLARNNPDLIYNIVNELVKSGDKNSYWIAYRSCRNLVKKEPIKVMNLLKTDEYIYKNRKHYRHDYQ